MRAEGDILKNKQASVLWEHTWQTEIDLGDGPGPYVRTFRVVGWIWEFDDGARRLGALLYEEQTQDGLGELCWRYVQHESVPQAAMAALLKQAGHLPADTDLSEVGE